MVSGAQMRRWYCQQSPRHRPAYCRSTAFFLEQKQGGLAARNTLANTSSRHDASRAEATPPTASGKRRRRVVARPLGSGRWLVALALAAIFTASRDPKAAPGLRRSPPATARPKKAAAPSRRGTNSEQRAALPTPPKSIVKNPQRKDGGNAKRPRGPRRAAVAAAGLHLPIEIAAQRDAGCPGRKAAT